jgi:hypothetical protein
MIIAIHSLSLLLVVVESLFDSDDVVAIDELSASAVSAHPLTKANAPAMIITIQQQQVRVIKNGSQ